jgi:CheY-like chemotaxis protein
MDALNSIASHSPLSGFRVLVAEDEILIALSAQAMLTEAGVGEIVVATAADEARKHLSRPRAFDAAVIDLNLGTGVDLSLAALARENEVPFVFATGYANTELPADLSGVPIIVKPYTPEMLIAAVREIAVPRRCKGF